MATYTFDGTSSITATKNDIVIVTADPTSFTQATDTGSSAVLAFGNATLTITGTTLTAAGLANVSVANAKFTLANTLVSTGPGTTTSELEILNTDGSAFTQSVATVAASKVAVFGGLGRVDTIDGIDTLNVGGKGTFAIYGDGGADKITNSVGAFDSTSVVNTFGGEGNDSVDFATVANTKASIFVSGGTGLDTIAVNNTGTTFIQGGLDSLDGADSITFATAGGAAGTSYIYGNGGDDVITIGQQAAGKVAALGIDSTSTTTVYGGYGADKMTILGEKATITAIGGEGSDTVTVVNHGGSTFITGGNPSGGDQSLDGADTITVDGSYGNIAVYGNLGNDVISAQVLGAAGDTTSTSTVNIYGGKGGDTITESNAAGGGKTSVFIAGGEDGDTISAVGNGGAVTIYGGISSSDTTDGSDSISYGVAGGSTGNANIFANAGNDTVSIGNLGVDTTNTVTVFGGIGNDSISIGVQNAGKDANNVQLVNETLVVNGNAGADSFTIAGSAGGTNSVGQTVTIADFKVGEGDTLTITGVAAGQTLTAVKAATYQTVQQALDAAANATGVTGAAAVTFNGTDTYVVINHTGGATATFNGATEQAIKLTGVTDASTLVGVTTVSA